MRESKFIEQNKTKWEKYEKEIPGGNMPPDEMERAFVELSDDLSYARTFYPKRAVRIFLNNTLAALYRKMNRSKPWSIRNFADFFSTTAPSVLYSSKKYLLFSFLTVLLGVFIGYFGTRQDYQFASVVLGSDYMRVTEYNIDNGDPLAIYKYQNPLDMFNSIALNNLRVAINFVVFGAFFCIGALFLLLNNGIALGAFTYIFTSRGLGSEYLLTVYQHGTLEVLGMVVEGAAGIMLGAGFLFPGNMPRLLSMKIAAKKSIVILLVCVPLIILAAFIESFLTRFTDIPDGFRLLFILISFVFMVFYFIVYPYLKRNSTTGVKFTDNAATWAAFRNGLQHAGKGNVLFDSVQFVIKNIYVIFGAGLLSALLFYSIDYLSGGLLEKEFDLMVRLNFGEAGFLASYSNPVTFIYQCKYVLNYVFTPLLSNYFIFIGTIVIASSLFIVAFKQSDFNAGKAKIILLSVGLSTILSAIMLVFHQYWFSILMFGYPLLLVFYTAMLLENSGSNSFVSAVKIVIFGFRKWILYVFLSILFFFLLYFGFVMLSYLLISVSENFHGYSTSDAEVMKIMSLLCVGILPFVFVLNSKILMKIILEQAEYNSGNKLFDRISKIGTKVKAYGIEME